MLSKQISPSLLFIAPNILINRVDSHKRGEEAPSRNFSTFSSFHSRQYCRPRLTEINTINGLQMKRFATAVSTVTTILPWTFARLDAQLKGHLTHLLSARREIKFAVSRPRFLLANTIVMIYSFAVAMINYECFTIIWKGILEAEVSRACALARKKADSFLHGSVTMILERIYKILRKASLHKSIISVTYIFVNTPRSDTLIF